MVEARGDDDDGSRHLRRPPQAVIGGFLFTETAACPSVFAAASHGGAFARSSTRTCSRDAGAEVAGWLACAGVPLVQTGFPAGDAAKGEKGFAALPDQFERYRASNRADPRLRRGTRLPHGPPDGGRPPVGVAPEKLWATYLENLAFAADAAARRGIDRDRRADRAAARSPTYVIDDPLLAVEAIRAIDRPQRPSSCSDAYHCVCLGHDPAALIREHAALIAHVQIAERSRPARAGQRPDRLRADLRGARRGRLCRLGRLRIPSAGRGPRRGSAGCGAG